MKTVNKELIDFLIEIRDTEYKAMPMHFREKADKLVKSINSEAPIETPNVNNNEVQKEDFCALLDELIVYGSNNGWWSRTIDLMKQLKQKYD